MPNVKERLPCVRDEAPRAVSLRTGSFAERKDTVPEKVLCFGR